MIALQIVTFMVLAIIGAVLAAIQMIVAADGAADIHKLYIAEDHLSTSRFFSEGFRKDVSFFRHA